MNSLKTSSGYGANKESGTSEVKPLAIVLDANILIRAVLVRRVSFLLFKYFPAINFCAPNAAFLEARDRLPDILKRRGMSVDPGMTNLSLVGTYVQAVDREFYKPFEASARTRLKLRDPNDWPILACALALDCPIWTEDRDFFGCGVATWTTDRVELYLRDPPAAAAAAE